MRSRPGRSTAPLRRPQRESARWRQSDGARTALDGAPALVRRGPDGAPLAILEVRDKRLPTSFGLGSPRTSRYVRIAIQYRPDIGIATCLEARTGEVVWKERLKGAYSASPIYAKGRIYLFNEEGLTTVIRPGRKLEVIASNALAKQPFMATPAVDGDAFIMRTGGHLYRVEAAK